MVKISFDIRTLKAALLCASTDAARFYLNGVAVQLDSDKLFVVATDGHRLLAMQPDCEIVRDDTDAANRAAFGSVIIPSDVIANLKPNRHINTCTLTIDGIKGEIEHCGQAVRFNFIDATFPQWRHFVPDTISGEVAQFNATYIGDLPKIAKVFGDKRTGFRINHNGKSPAFADLGLPVSHLFLLMPFVSTKEIPAYEMPVWARRNAPAQSQAA